MDFLELAWTQVHNHVSWISTFFSLSALESPECGANSRVVDVDGVPVCECIEGYEGNETVCTGLFVDIVEQIGSTSSKK